MTQIVVKLKEQWEKTSIKNNYVIKESSSLYLWEQKQNIVSNKGGKTVARSGCAWISTSVKTIGVYAGFINSC